MAEIEFTRFTRNDAADEAQAVADRVNATLTPECGALFWMIDILNKIIDRIEALENQ